MYTPVYVIVCCLWQTFPPFVGINLDQNYSRFGRKAVGINIAPLRVKSNVLIQCQASGLRSNPQTFISPPWAISGGIRGPAETKSWWIELISPLVMDGPVHRGLENGSIVHLSLRLPCPSMICARVVKATSSQKTSLSLPLTHPAAFFFFFFSLFFSGVPSLSIVPSTPTTFTDIHTAGSRKTSLYTGA